MPAHLFIRTGPNNGEIHALGESAVVIGRAMDCEVRLADAHASRKHFRVENRNGSYWLVDLGSKNRTGVNGVPVHEKQLNWGDEIRVGLTRLVFLSGTEPSLLSTDSQAGRRTKTAMTSGGRFDMIGSSPEMRQVFMIIEKTAPLDVSVLVTGESGTGKELVAHALHSNSPRADGPLVAVNCAAIPRDLMESELFGHEKGAFTGAHARRQGKFELASGGTLFLDEIGDLPPESQPKLLRVLEEKKVTPVGGDKPIDVDVRVVTATNRDLHAETQSGNFRQDLLFRLEVVNIRLPALRDRIDDIFELARFFLDRYKGKASQRLEEFSAEAMEELMKYSWPGNIRELKNVIERAVIMSPGPLIGPDDILLPRREQSGGKLETLAELEKRQINKAMALADGNKKRAAEILGIPRSSLYNKLKEYGLE
jgi:two-component system, NtrC family, response regulator HydG